MIFLINYYLNFKSLTILLGNEGWRVLFFDKFLILIKATVKKIEELIHRNIHLPKSHPNKKSGEIKVNCNNKTLTFNSLFILFLSPIKICPQMKIVSIQIAGIQIQPPPSKLVIVDNGKLIPWPNVQERDPIAPEGLNELGNSLMGIIVAKFNHDSFILKAIK